MPQDMDSISPEELFAQRFKQQIASDEGTGDGEKTADSSEGKTNSGAPGQIDIDTVPEYGEAEAPDAINGVASSNPEESSDPSAPVKSAGENADAKIDDKGAVNTQKTEAGKKPEEAWDENLVKIKYESTPEIEWKEVFDMKEEAEDIDDGRKDGVAGLNGEMEDADVDEIKTITEKEFQAQLLNLLMPMMLKFFRPEFLNRFDEIIFFSPLRKKELIQIVDVMLREIREMLNEKNIQLKLTDAARELIAEKGYNPAFGARPLRRAIQDQLEDPLSDLLIKGAFVEGDTIFTDAVGGKLEFKKDIGGGKVEDPFAELDKKNKKEGENNEGEKEVEDPFAVLDAEENKGQIPPTGKAVPAGQPQATGNMPVKQVLPPVAGQLSPFQQAANNAVPVENTETIPQENIVYDNTPQKKKSFLEKMFVKSQATGRETIQQPVAPQGGGGGIRFVDGQIVEE